MKKCFSCLPTLALPVLVCLRSLNKQRSQSKLLAKTQHETLIFHYFPKFRRLPSSFAEEVILSRKLGNGYLLSKLSVVVVACHLLENSVREDNMIFYTCQKDEHVAGSLFGVLM